MKKIISMQNKDYLPVNHLPSLFTILSIRSLEQQVELFKQVNFLIKFIRHDYCC